MIDMDKVLKKALSPTEYPSDELNERILSQMEMRMMEGETVRTRKIGAIAAAVVVICLLIIPVSVYAAYKYLLPKEAAREMDDSKLEQAFEEQGTDVLQTVTDGSYKVTYLGHVTGETISDRTNSAWELNPDRLYVAVAVERTDGAPMGFEDNIFVTPLIQGLAPWKYNIVTMNGSFIERIIDGILYRIIECDNIEIFADRKLYLAVSNTPFFSSEAFSLDEVTGEISANEDFEGTNVLFDLVLDPSKADPAKAREYLEEFEKAWNADFESSDVEDGLTNDEDKDNEDEVSTSKQQEYFVDESNGITIRIKDNNSRRWSAGPDHARTVFQYYLEVIGENIDTLTFTLNKGEFCEYLEEYSPSKAEHYGNVCSLSYDEQKDRNYMYAIDIKGLLRDYGYDPEEVKKLGVTEEGDKKGHIYYDVLDRAISDTKMVLEIKMKDGRKIIKNITFKNVSDIYVSGERRFFRIVMNVE